MTFVDLLWLLLFVLVAAGGATLSMARLGYWFTPLSVFVGVNCASLVSYHLRLLNMNDVSLVTHVVVLVCLGAFVTGALAAVGRGRACEAPLAAGRLDRRGLAGFFYITALLSTLGWLLAAFILVGRLGLASLLRNIWVLQHEFQMQFVGYLNMVGILVLPTYLVRRAAGGSWGWDLLLAVSSVFGLLLAGIKAYLIYSALASLFVWSVLYPHRFRPRVLVLGLLALLGFFILYTQRVDVFSNELYVGDSWFSNLTALHRPYIYFSGPWPAMDNLVHGDLPDPVRLGSVTLQPLWKLLGDGLGLIEPVPFTQPFTDIGTTLFNVYTFFGEVYRDWGWAGSVLLSLLLGFVSTRLYLRARAAGYWAHLLVYGVIGYGVFLSCFMYTYRFNMMVMLVYLYAVGFVAMRGGVLVERRPHA